MCNALLTFQRQQEKIFDTFFLGPGLISTFPSFSVSIITNSKKEQHSINHCKIPET